MSNQAFYYVDGEPLKGVWVDLDIIGDDNDVLEELAAAGKIERDEVGDPVYGGDLLVADVEGDLAKAFLSKYGSFDLAGFIDARDYCDSNRVDYEAAAAYLDNVGSWDQGSFEDVYCGEYDSEEAYAEELFDKCYLQEIPENLRYYIDYEKFARDLFRGGDYFFANGYVFRNN